MFNIYSTVGRVMRVLMTFLVPLHTASFKLLRWFDNTPILSISGESDGSMVYRHPIYDSYGLRLAHRKGTLPRLSIVRKPDANKLHTALRIKNTCLQRVLYRGHFDKNAPCRRVNPLFVYLDDTLCTGLFDKCCLTCKVFAKDLPIMMGMEGSIVRVIDEDFEEHTYTGNDEIFTI